MKCLWSEFSDALMTLSFVKSLQPSVLRGFKMCGSDASWKLTIDGTEEGEDYSFSLACDAHYAEVVARILTGVYSPDLHFTQLQKG